MRKIIRTILVGGVWFLLPLVFIVVLIEKAYEIIKVVATPLSKLFSTESIAGIAHEEILTVVIMLVGCVFAGLAARSHWGRRLRAKFDTVLLYMIPGYSWVKGVIGGIDDDDSEKVLKPVLVRFDDFSQLAFESDRTTDGLVAVYLPDAPDPRSGAVGYVTADRVQPIDVGFQDVVKSCRNLGHGSLAMLSQLAVDR